MKRTAITFAQLLFLLCWLAALALFACTVPNVYGREYDAESDIGLVAENATPVVAARNTERLSAALDAQWPGGKFRFVDRRLGPVLHPIRAAAKEFFFAGTIKASQRIGGALYGMGSRSYMLPSGGYNGYGVGGAVTRFTRIDGGNTSKGNVSILRLPGAGFTVDGIEFRGRYYNGDSTAEGPDGPGASPGGTVKTPVGIEVEGRDGTPTTTRDLIRNCTIAECGYGICARGGYYDDAGKFIVTNTHADESLVDGTAFVSCGSCFRSETQQAVGWVFRDCHISGFGGAGYAPCIMADMDQGGDVHWVRPIINHPAITLFRVNHYSQHCARLTCTEMRWDRGSAKADDDQGRPYYLTLFEYAGRTDDPDMSWAKWTLRVTGNISNGETDPPGYHAERLIVIPEAARKVGIPTADLLFDITRLPHKDFELVGGGPWWRAK